MKYLVQQNLRTDLIFFFNSSMKIEYERRKKRKKKTLHVPY